MAKRMRTICSKWTTKNCSKCKSAHYCSVECQMKGRPLHKLLGDKYASLIEAGPPSPDKDGHESDESEKFHNNETDQDTDGEENRDNAKSGTNSKNYRKSKNDDESNDDVSTDYRLAICFPQWSQVPDLFWLKCTTENEPGDDAEGQSPFSHLSNFMDHPTAMRCVPGTGSRFEVYGDDNGSNNRFERDKLKSVLHPCSGDMIFMKKRRYRNVEVRRDHPIFTDKQVDVPPIAEHLGFPLLVQELPLDRSWADKITSDTPFDPYENAELVVLMMDLAVKDPEENYGWGLPPVKWYLPRHGSEKMEDMMSSLRLEGLCADVETKGPIQERTALVVRKDGKDLISEQIEALVEYARKVDWLIRDDEMGEFCEKEARMALVQEHFLSSEFDDFFDKLKQEKLSEGSVGHNMAIYFIYYNR
ncbi:hypothetical protein BDZ45DRAFT_727639 [Acephala macrosclerotiorum]|nr:hypothetical protein BDZ45DRAFT_727639 [Acephala macrosclerotiorum]